MNRGLYTYAFLRPGQWNADGLLGVDEAAVELIRYRDLATAVSDVDMARLDLPDEEVTEGSGIATLARWHDDVIRALFAATPVLPLQLGTVVADRAGAEKLIESRYDEVDLALAELADAEEWGVCVRQTEPERVRPNPPVETSGTAYLARRKEDLRRADDHRAQQNEVAEIVAAALHPYAREWTPTSRSRPGVVLDLAYLVTTGRTEEFLATTHRLAKQAEPAGVELHVTGPWPPYTFARLKLGRHE